ncbi:MAG: triacylglycerol lipase [Myxococcales bacterium]|nr:triacylglycerol lipase [Myxococcales bacterium]
MRGSFRVSVIAAALVAGLSAASACGGGDSVEEGYTGSGGSSSGGAPSGGSGGTLASGGYSAVGGQLDAGPDVDASPKLGPPYPVVLAHGFFGFEKFAGLDAITYFYQVRAELAAKGEPLVFTPAVDPFNDSTFRGAQLEAEIEKILAQTGHAKVNLIGHSQGGLDARVVAHDRPDLVASVTTIATPHQGTPMADVLLGLVADSSSQKLIDWLVKQIGYALYDTTGKKTSLWKPLELFSKSGIAAFNQTYTDRASVRYWSITGRSDFKLAEMDCKPDSQVPFIEKYNFQTDPIDALLLITEAYLDGGLAQPDANDGLVRVKDAKWGTFLGCVPADHLDEVGQLFGDSPGIGNGFKHKELYVALVEYLRAQGL